MFACKFNNGKFRLLSTIPSDAIDSFEFDIKDLPIAPDDDNKYRLEVDFDNHAFNLIKKELPLVEKEDTTEERLNDLETMMIDHEYKFTLLELELL